MVSFVEGFLCVKERKLHVPQRKVMGGEGLMTNFFSLKIILQIHLLRLVCHIFCFLIYFAGSFYIGSGLEFNIVLYPYLKQNVEIVDVSTKMEVEGYDNPAQDNAGMQNMKLMENNNPHDAQVGMNLQFSKLLAGSLLNIKCHGAVNNII